MRRSRAVSVGLAHEVILTFAGVAEEKVRLEDCRLDGLLPETARRITPQSLSHYNMLWWQGLHSNLEWLTKFDGRSHVVDSLEVRHMIYTQLSWVLNHLVEIPPT